MKISVPDTAEWLRRNDDYLILTHRRPDGDTLGCAGALASHLQENGKTAYVLFNEETTDRYLDLVSDFWAPEGFEPKHVISVDTANNDLFGENARRYCKNISLCIDHHVSNTVESDYKCTDAERAACGELVYDILFAFCDKIGPKTAGCLYAAVVTDTGCFAYANTTAQTLEVAAKLIKAGAPHKQMNKIFFRTKTKARVKLEAMIFSGMELYFNEEAAIVTITRAMLSEIGAAEDDLDDISALAGIVEGVKCAVTIRQLAEKTCKISVRSLPGINSNDICAGLGGGGHAMAAGATVEKTTEEAKAEILLILDDVFGTTRCRTE